MLTKDVTIDSEWSLLSRGNSYYLYVQNLSKQPVLYSYDLSQENRVLLGMLKFDRDVFVRTIEGENTLIVTEE